MKKPHLRFRKLSGNSVFHRLADIAQQAGFADGVFIDVSKRVGDQLEGDAIEGAVCKFDREWFLGIGVAIYFFDAVEDRLVLMIIIGDVEELRSMHRDLRAISKCSHFHRA